MNKSDKEKVISKPFPCVSCPIDRVRKCGLESGKVMRRSGGRGGVPGWNAHGDTELYEGCSNSTVIKRPSPAQASSSSSSSFTLPRPVVRQNELPLHLLLFLFPLRSQLLLHGVPLLCLHLRLTPHHSPIPTHDAAGLHSLSQGESPPSVAFSLSPSVCFTIREVLDTAVRFCDVDF